MSANRTGGATGLRKRRESTGEWRPPAIAGRADGGIKAVETADDAVSVRAPGG